MKRSSASILVASAAAVALTASCGRKGGPSEGTGGKTGACAQVLNAYADRPAGNIREKVIHDIGDNVLLPLYTDLSNGTHALHAAVKKLQLDPTQANLETAQKAWRASRVPWEKSETLLFGPVASLSLDPQMDIWPTDLLELREILKQRPQVDAAFVRAQSNGVKGFHAIEHLLFGFGESSVRKKIGEMTSPEMSYLVAATEVLNENTASLLSAWAERSNPEDACSPRYLSVFKNPGFDNKSYPSFSLVYQELLGGMRKIVEEVQGGKLAVTDPAKVESQFSWNSLEDFENNIQGLLHVYTGDYGDKQGEGLDTIVRAASPELDRKVRAQINDSITKIRGIAGPKKISFTEAIQTAEGQARIRVAIEALDVLFATLGNELRPVLVN